MATKINGIQLSFAKAAFTGSKSGDFILDNSDDGLIISGSRFYATVQTPVTDGELATKKYVDDNTGGATVSTDEVVFGKSGGGFDSLPAVKLVNGSQTGDGALDFVLDLSTTGSFRSSARMFQVTGSVNVAEAISLKTGAGHTASTIAIVNAANTSDGAILIDAEAGGLTLAAGDDSLKIDADGTDADALDIDSAGGMDVDVAGVVDINAGDDSVIAVTTEAKDLALTVSGGGAQVLQLNSAGTGTDAIDINATAGGIDIDANGALSLDGGSINIGTAANVAVDFNASTLDIDAAGAITIDGTSTFSVDGVGASNVTTNGALTLSGSTGVTLAAHDGSVSLLAEQAGVSVAASEDTSSNAIDIAATAGGIDISAAGGAGKGIDLNTGGTSILSLNTTAGGGLIGGAVATSFQQATSLVLPSYFEVSGSSSGNGTTTSFATNAAAVPSSIRVYLNGVRQEINGGSTNDYSLGASNAVVFETAPVTDDVVVIEWRQGSS